MLRCFYSNHHATFIRHLRTLLQIRQFARCLGAVYSITTFIREITPLLQIRQFARLRSASCSLQGLIASFYLVDRGLWHRLPGILGFGPACWSSVGRTRRFRCRWAHYGVVQRLVWHHRCTDVGRVGDSSLLHENIIYKQTRAGLSCACACACQHAV